MHVKISVAGPWISAGEGKLRIADEGVIRFSDVRKTEAHQLRAGDCSLSDRLYTRNPSEAQVSQGL